MTISLSCHRHIIAAFILGTFIAVVPFRVSADETNSLTHGNVQLNLRVGETTQLEVIEVFGAPNVTTMDGEGREVWIYRRHATVTASESKSGGFVIGLLAIGGVLGGGGGLSGSKSSSGFEQSSQVMTLIIKFNEAKIVSDFRSRSSSF